MFNRLVGVVSPNLFSSAAAVSMLALMLGGTPLTAASTDRKTPPSPDSVVGNSGLKLSQPEMLREFEAASQQEYTLGAGDEIEIQVPSQTDLQGKQIVGPDGIVTLPLVGSLKVSGLTREAAAQAMAKAWKQYYATIDVSIRVTKYGSNRVVVVGKVAQPGPLYFETAPTLLEVLAKSGAYSTRPMDTSAAASSIKGAAPASTINRCAIYRGSEQVLWVDMRELFTSGGGVDVHLRRDDVVYVPDEQDDLVSVLGQVEHPGAVRLTSETRLVDLIALTGGLTDDAARNKIRLVRPSTGMTREFNFKDLIDPAHAQLAEISLQRGDVIYVPKNALGKMGYVVGKFSPAGSLMMVGALAAGR